MYWSNIHASLHYLTVDGCRHRPFRLAFWTVRFGSRKQLPLLPRIDIADHGPPMDVVAQMGEIVFRQINDHGDRFYTRRSPALRFSMMSSKAATGLP